MPAFYKEQSFVCKRRWDSSVLSPLLHGHAKETAISQHHKAHCLASMRFSAANDRFVYTNLAVAYNPPPFICLLQNFSDEPRESLSQIFLIAIFIYTHFDPRCLNFKHFLARRAC